MIKTWQDRCTEHPDHQSGMVSHAMIQARMQEEIDELRVALAQPKPEPEPVAWMKRLYLPGDDWDAYDFSANQYGEFQIPLYSIPPQRKSSSQEAMTRKPLTDEEIMDIVDAERARMLMNESKLCYRVARAVISALDLRKE